MSIIEEDYENIAGKLDISRFEGKSILVTGATGFIGGHIVGFIMYLKQMGYVSDCKVIAVCRNKSKAMERFSHYEENDGFDLIIGELVETISYMNGIDYIIHAASISNTVDFERYPADLLISNIIGTWRLLELAKTKKAKLLFLSSGAVYGEYPEDISVIDEEDIFLNHYLQPHNSYATGKRGGEALCSAYAVQFGVNTTIVRISHTYGPLINLYDGKVFSDFVRNILNGEDLTIKGDGLAYRPYCYISDTIAAIFISLFYGRAGQVYNIANPNETLTVRELADILVLYAFPERNLKIKYIREHINQKDVKKICVSVEKMKTLGWEPVVTVIDGFRRTVESFGGL